jgi:Dihydrodipicolinate synthase/N-acetylneuraminate lyase
MKELRGTGVALVTPFKASGAIDFNALERHISHCIEGGVDYLVVMGTTGENPTLDAAEKKAVLVAALEACNGRVPVVYGLGGNNTRALIYQMKGLDTKGLTALL